MPRVTYGKGRFVLYRLDKKERIELASNHDVTVLERMLSGLNPDSKYIIADAQEAKAAKAAAKTVQPVKANPKKPVNYTPPPKALTRQAAIKRGQHIKTLSELRAENAIEAAQAMKRAS